MKVYLVYQDQWSPLRHIGIFSNYEDAKSAAIHDYVTTWQDFTSKWDEDKIKITLEKEGYKIKEFDLDGV